MSLNRSLEVIRKQITIINHYFFVPVQVLEHMEAVERNPGVGECRRRYQLHVVGEVHAHPCTPVPDSRRRYRGCDRRIWRSQDGYLTPPL